VASLKRGPRKKVVWRSGQDVAVLDDELLKFDIVATFVPPPAPPPPAAPPPTPAPTPAPIAVTPAPAPAPAIPPVAAPSPEADSQAQRNAELAAYEIARASASERGWEQFLTKYANGLFTAEARRALADLKAAAEKQRGDTAAFMLAESQNSEHAWEEFVKTHQTSQLAVLAQARLDALRKSNQERENSLHAKAMQTDLPEDWDALIKAFPSGRFAAEASTKKTSATQRVADQTALKGARSTDTLEAWKSYLEKFPSGAGAADGRRRFDQLTWLETADIKSLMGGSFMMGNAKGEDDEKPVHRVDLDPFRIGRSEVSNALYQKFVDETKRARPRDPDFAKNYMAAHPDLPVVNVTYQDALAFCKWLSGKTGAVVRLPTEAEWEYAAVSGRGGRLYPWGNADPQKFARFKDNSSGSLKTVAKDAFPPSDLELRNMAGNVAEWVSDFYSEEAYAGGAKKNPAGPADGKERVVRGGSFESSKEEISVTRRSRSRPDKAEPWLGFRIVVQ
jgi:formylglycine-generating enzyme required for sulfatase activity